MLNIVGEEIEKKQKKMLKRIYKFALKANGQSPRLLETTLEFVYSVQMQELNQRMRNIDETTDVLSFPNLEEVFNKKITKKEYKTDINPENNKIYLGDIVINLDRMVSQAIEYGHSTEREMCYLFVHGILHLLGFDHIDELDRNIMRSQEEKILSKFKLKRG